MGVLTKVNIEHLGSEEEQKEFRCFNCEEKIVNSNYANGIKQAGYWHGWNNTFLCTSCAKHDDLHILGALIGDAIIASDYCTLKNRMHKDYYLKFGKIEYVENFMKRLEASIYRAIVFQLWNLLRYKDNPED